MNIRGNASAYIASGATVNAGTGASDDVLVRASLTETADGEAYAGQAGALALGAQVVVINSNSTQQAYIAGGAKIERVTMQSIADRLPPELAQQIHPD